MAIGNTFMAMGGSAAKAPLPVGDLTVGDGTNPAAAQGQLGNRVIRPGSAEHKAIDQRIKDNQGEVDKVHTAAAKEAEVEAAKVEDPEAKKKEEAKAASTDKALAGLGDAMVALGNQQMEASAGNRLQAPAAHKGNVTTPDLSFKGRPVGGALSGVGGAF